MMQKINPVRRRTTDDNPQAAYDRLRGRSLLLRQLAKSRPYSPVRDRADAEVRRLAAELAHLEQANQTDIEHQHD